MQFTEKDIKNGKLPEPDKVMEMLNNPEEPAEAKEPAKSEADVPPVVAVEDCEESKFARTQTERQVATGLVMGSGTVICGQTIDSPAIATITILKMIGSPFVCDTDRDIEDVDIIEALYVLTHKKDVLTQVVEAKEKQKALSIVERKVADNKDFFTIYAQLVMLSSSSMASFKKDAVLWGQTLGSFDVNETAQQLAEYINACMFGFQWLSTAEKKTNSTQG